MPYLTDAALAADLAVRDLTDPAAGPHAIQLILDAVLNAATARWPSIPLTIHRGSRIVDVADNYDRLGYSPDAAARDARYTRYVSHDRMLRSQTSALIPGALRALTSSKSLIACPGIVYRRDAIDRLHTGTPHQLDLWRITTDPPAPATPDPAGAPGSATAPGPAGAQCAAGAAGAAGAADAPGATGAAGAPGAAGVAGATGVHPPAEVRGEDIGHRCSAADELIELVAVVVSAALPGTPWRTRPATHPYTTGGREIQAWSGHDWVEIGECGVAAAHVLQQPDPSGPAPELQRPAMSGPVPKQQPPATNGTAPEQRRVGLGGPPPGPGLRPPCLRGLALGLGLDRILMLRKGIADIRLLRSADPRVAGQMTSLAPYRPVPSGPAARRDLSVAMPAGITAEELGDRVRDLLGPDAGLVEEVAIRSVTSAADLPAASRARLAIRDDEVNVLLRVILRDPHGTLPGARANELRDRIWQGLTTRPPIAAGG
ncbi:phenylalanyl-tRNA synthetase alpha chain [Actinoplanes tereljensis]|uniref:FDX-ACB domain-containing protein n=1 Tax=Paractinoplanes tereljensis TaxID=571912 RepID=A0A919NNB5_9ACTN|nr:hypothetical protein [Actinoplanes tereljensis]GIF22014.1 hypothetical protein Ate02nite_47440 [Actinoplanes tereljensis]